MVVHRFQPEMLSRRDGYRVLHRANSPPLVCLANPRVGDAAAHFSVSVAIWLYWFIGIFRNPDMRGEFIPSLLPSASAFLLYGLSAALFILALRGPSSSTARRTRFVDRITRVFLDGHPLSAVSDQCGHRD